MRDIRFVERWHHQPYYRVLINMEIVYQSLSRKRAYDFYLLCKKCDEEENRKEEK